MVSSTLPVEMLVPHRAPMLLIDSVLLADDTEIWASASLTADSAFMLHGRVSTAVGLEYLAQTAAAFFTLQSNEVPAPVRQGMLIACPRLDADIAWFVPGDVLLLHAWPVSRMPVAGKTVDQSGRQAGGLVKFKGEIHVLAQGMPIPIQLPLAEPGVVRAELSVYL